MTHADETLALLAAANPVSELPAAEPPERLRRLIEAEGHAVGGTRRRTPADRLVRPLAAMLLTALLTATIGLLLSNGASSPSFNVAAAAYAATSSGSGVLEARFVEHLFLPGRRVVAAHYREWIDASSGMRRERSALPALVSRTDHRPSHVVDELAQTPSWTEFWSSADEVNVIHRIRTPASRTVVGDPRPTPNGGDTQTPEGLETYRRLYREGAIRLVGRERRDGRLLWKLEGDVAFAVRSPHAKPVPIMTVVVLVDPRTYLPVIQRTVDLFPGRPRQVRRESELLGYRRLPSGAASEAVLKVSAQHPGVPVVTGPTARSPRSHYIRNPTP